MNGDLAHNSSSDSLPSSLLIDCKKLLTRKIFPVSFCTVCLCYVRGQTNQTIRYKNVIQKLFIKIFNIPEIPKFFVIVVLVACIIIDRPHDQYLTTYYLQSLWS